MTVGDNMHFLRECLVLFMAIPSVKCVCQPFHDQTFNETAEEHKTQQAEVQNSLHFNEDRDTVFEKCELQL